MIPPMKAVRYYDSMPMSPRAWAGSQPNINSLWTSVTIDIAFSQIILKLNDSVAFQGSIFSANDQNVCKVKFQSYDSVHILHRYSENTQGR